MKTDASKIKVYWWVSVAVILVWTSGYIIGDRLPYLYTDLAFKARAFVIFPIILGTFIYLAFVFKSKKAGGKTGYRWVMDRLPSRGKRLKYMLVFIFGYPAISAAISSTFIQFPIWAAYLTALTPFTQTYTVTKIRHLGGPLWSAMFDLTLDAKDAESVDLRLDRWRYYEHPWEVGDVICVRGRTSIFGTIMETTTRGACS